MPDLSLRVPAVPENVIVVRELLRGIEALLPRRGLSEAVLTAVSEAANNVVVHAYEGAVGPLEVAVSIQDGLEVSVRDWGAGFAAEAEPSGDDQPGFGRDVIAAFADDVTVRSTPGAGSEVRLRWAVPPLLRQVGGDPGTPLPGDTVLTVRADPALSRSVARVTSALAARAGFAVDRLADVRVIGEVLTSEAEPLLVGSELSLAFLQRPSGLQITAGRFIAGGVDALRSARTVNGGRVIDQLADDLEVLRDPGTDHELLVLSVGTGR